MQTISERFAAYLITRIPALQVRDNEQFYVVFAFARKG